ncbi:hypothetical protein ACFL0V_01170 [Nanoarchaeota archaeon]
MNDRLKTFWKIVTNWKFLLSLQSALIILLYIIGNIRSFEENSKIFISRIPEAIVNLVGTILGFPSGIYFLFTTKRIFAGGITGALVAYLVPLVYYSLFIVGLVYIAKKKKYFKKIALVLFIFMLLSFAGCSRVIELPLIIT